MLRRLHRLCCDQIGLRDFGARFLSVKAGNVQTTKVNPAAFSPRHLEDNINDLELMLADDVVKRDEKLWGINQDSFNTLKLFLKQYTDALSKADYEYLPSRRHALEFIVKDDTHEIGLKRVVCHIGTTGGDSHRLVTRALQGLFNEVGLSPNFIWDKSYTVGEVHMTPQQRNWYDEQRVNAIHDQIISHQQGKELPADSPLKVANEDAAFPLTTPAAAPVGTSEGPDHDEDDDMPDLDLSAFGDDASDELRVKELQNICNHLAMKPWVEVQSDARRATEEETAETMFFHTQAAGCHMRALMARVWGGARKLAALQREFAECDPVRVPSELIQQVVECTKRLERAFGAPLPANPVPIKQLQATIRSVNFVVDILDELVSSSDSELADDDASGGAASSRGGEAKPTGGSPGARERAAGSGDAAGHGQSSGGGGGSGKRGAVAADQAGAAESSDSAAAAAAKPTLRRLQRVPRGKGRDAAKGAGEPGGSASTSGVDEGVAADAALGRDDVEGEDVAQSDKAGEGTGDKTSPARTRRMRSRG